MMTKKILSKFYKDNRIDHGGRVYYFGQQLREGMLNRIQRAAVVHGMDLHQTVPAWKDKWIIVKDKDGREISSYRSKDPRELGIRSDLPPIAIQWKQEYSTRFGGTNHV
jgi:hypothetical protein